MSDMRLLVEESGLDWRGRYSMASGGTSGAQK
jgi:hypothetical protein